MDTINFYDKNRNLQLKFSNFKKNNDYLETIIFDCNMDFDFTHFSTKLESEISELKYFLDNLTKIHAQQQHFASFKPIPFYSINSGINMLFSEDKGQIEVKCGIFYAISNKDISTCELVFTYNTDQSFLPELINEIEEVLRL